MLYHFISILCVVHFVLVWKICNSEPANLNFKLFLYYDGTSIYAQKDDVIDFSVGSL